MARAARFKEHADKREAGGYVPLPHVVLRSREWCELSYIERTLLLDLLSQYRGDNNGDLSAYWRLMVKRGWRSKQTLYKALKGLEEKGFIVLTKQGARNHQPSLYAVTFFRIDPCGGKIDLKGGTDFRGAWRRYEQPMPDLTPTRWPKDSNVRELVRLNDPAKLSELVRQEVQIPPAWYEERTRRRQKHA